MVLQLTFNYKIEGLFTSCQRINYDQNLLIFSYMQLSIYILKGI